MIIGIIPVTFEDGMDMVYTGNTYQRNITVNINSL